MMHTMNSWRSDFVPMHVTTLACAQGTTKYAGELYGAKTVGGFAQCQRVGSLSVGLPPRYHERIYDPVQLCISLLAQCAFGEGRCSSSATAEESCSGGAR